MSLTPDQQDRYCTLVLRLYDKDRPLTKDEEAELSRLVRDRAGSAGPHYSGEFVGVSRKAYLHFHREFSEQAIIDTVQAAYDFDPVEAAKAGHERMRRDLARAKAASKKPEDPE